MLALATSFNLSVYVTPEVGLVVLLSDTVKKPVVALSVAATTLVLAALIAFETADSPLKPFNTEFIVSIEFLLVVACVFALSAVLFTAANLEAIVLPEVNPLPIWPVMTFI